MEKIYKFIYDSKVPSIKMETYVFVGTDITTNIHNTIDRNILLLRNPETNELIRERAYESTIDNHIHSFYGGEYIFYSKSDDMNNFLQRLSKELEKKVSWAKEDAEKYKTKLYWAELKLKEDEDQYKAVKEILENRHDKDAQERE